MQQTELRNSDRPSLSGEPKAAFERAYDAILELIVRQELRPGQVTSVIALSDRLGIGRTPIKEAITRLATEGILNVRGRRGTYVARLEEQNVRHIFALRKLFENYAAPLAAANITRLGSTVKPVSRCSRSGSCERPMIMSR